MLPNDHATDEFDSLSDTDRKVGLIVRRIKEELEAHRDQQEDMLRRVFREVLAEDNVSIRKKLHNILAWITSQIK